MNRQTKRMLQRQGELGPDGAPVRAPQQRPQPRSGERTGVVQFGREVKGELSKVAWPGREEVIRYSVVVLVTLVLVTALIAGVDFVFSKSVFFLFDQ